MNVPSGPESRVPDAPAPAGPAYSETVLATDGARLTSVNRRTGELPGDPAGAPASLADRLRALPSGIVGTWLGLVCIVLLVASTAALRSLFAPAGLVPGKPAVAAPTSSATAAPGGTLAAAPKADGPPAGTGSGAALGGGNVGLGGGGGLPGFGALAIRDRLLNHVRLRKYGPFLEDLERLLDVEPSAIDRPDVRKMITDVAVYVMVPGPVGAISPEAEKLFSLLAGRAGAAGPDILFDLVTTRGGTRAATYAEEMLKREELRAKGTPAFKAAYDLRTAPSCAARVALFDRVKQDGDRRALATLFQMSKCGRGPTDCCLSNDPGYKDVVRAINARK